ncbi:MAG: permease prefix domain 1-containing protein [Clostridiaceae bacterium]|nr:permease prefix domain 1-containing protein [Clostridiaceae bacterium]
MVTIKDYLEELFGDIPDSVEKENIKQEIMQNLEEKVQDLMQEGKTEEDAINKSIVDFGDIHEIRNNLMQADQPKSAKKDISRYKNNLWFSICGSVLIIGLFLFINFYYTPYIIWFVYPTFAILWWPLGTLFALLSIKKK